MAQLSWPFSLLLLLLYLCFQVLAIDSLGLAKDQMSGKKWVSYSSVLETDMISGGISDKELNGICKQAYNEMKAAAAKDGVPEQKVPYVVTALAVGSKIYLGSSIKGGREYWYKENFRDAPPQLAQGLQNCETEGKIHRVGGGCGEINTIALSYELEPAIQLSGGKITTWGRTPNDLNNKFRQACGRPDPNKPTVSDWGCWKATAHFGLDRIEERQAEDPGFSVKIVSEGRKKCTTK